jgi:hypothetical protein
MAKELTIIHQASTSEQNMTYPPHLNAFKKTKEKDMGKTADHMHTDPWGAPTQNGLLPTLGEFGQGVPFVESPGHHPSGLFPP